jgi:hypothetical protein
MRIEAVKDHPYLNIPVIGGIISILVAIAYSLKWIGQFTAKDSSTRTTTEHFVRGGGFLNDGDRVVKKTHEHGSPAPLILIAIVGYAIYLLSTMVVDVTLYLGQSDFALLAPICLTGLIAALHKKDINKYVEANPPEKEQFPLSWHFIAGLLVAYVIAGNLEDAFVFKTQTVFEFFILFIPITLYIFFAFVAPISIAITFIVAYYKSRKSAVNLVTLVLITSVGMSCAVFIDGEQTKAKAEAVKIDKEVAKKQESLDMKKTNKVAMYISTTPSNAKVQIMNIKAKYKDGIVLSPGVYRIRVSADEYRTRESDYTFEFAGVREKHIKLPKYKKREWIREKQRRIDAEFEKNAPKMEAERKRAYAELRAYNERKAREAKENTGKEVKKQPIYDPKVELDRINQMERERVAKEANKN